MVSGEPTDRYTPAPGTAECPFCATVVPGVDRPSAARLAVFTFDCPGCGREWIEIRNRAGAGRYYARVHGPAPLPQEAPDGR